MVERFVRWLFGYVYIHIKGESATRFVNLCNGKDMLLWGINKNSEAIECYISLKNYKKLKPIAKKCKTIPYIKKRIGIPFIVKRIRKRKILLCAILLFIVTIYIFSLYVWNIGFEGNHIHTEEKMRMFLKEMNVEIGSKKSNINCAYIETMIRKTYPDIGWVSVELKGTKLFVRIEETTIPKSAARKIESNLTSANIVSLKEGIIQSVMVRSGTSKIKEGDIVKKGDILVSGIVNIIGDNQVVTASHKVVPDADIIMKTAENYYESFSMLYEKKQYTGVEKSGYDIMAFTNKIFSYNPSNSYLEYDIIREVVNLKINKNFYLPFAYQRITYKEYYMEQVVYTQEEANQIAEKNLVKHLNELNESGASVISCDTKTNIINGECITSGRIVMLESAYEYKAMDVPN